MRDETTLSAPAPTVFPRRWAKVKTWTLRLAEYGSVQIGVQALNAIAGLLIVRYLSKPEYALFAIVNSMQSTANLLADLGIGIGVRSIGGRVWQDRERFGQLLNTTISLRRMFAAVSMTVTLPIAAWMLWHNGADWLLTLALLGTVVLSIIPLLASTAWGTSAQLHGEYRRMQKLDLGNALLRCLAIGGLALIKLNVVLAAAVGTITSWTAMIFLRLWAREKINHTAPVNAEDKREMIRLSLKSLPNTIFFCFQGQITLLILTLVGNTKGIADVMALGRIAVLFTIFSVTFSNVLAPRFARCQDAVKLPNLYLLLVGGSSGLLFALSLIAWLLPGPFLWLLGPKYSSLENELVWVVAASCVSMVGGVMWGLNSSKAWIHIQAYGYMPSIILCQVIAACLLDLRQFHDVLIFNLVSACAPLPVFAFDAVRGVKNLKSVSPDN
jgi:O-antigen/teichoic acid export membrane protein